MSGRRASHTRVSCVKSSRAGVQAAIEREPTEQPPGRSRGRASGLQCGCALIAPGLLAAWPPGRLAAWPPACNPPCLGRDDEIVSLKAEREALAEEVCALKAEADAVRADVERGRADTTAAVAAYARRSSDMGARTCELGHASSYMRARTCELGHASSDSGRWNILADVPRPRCPPHARRSSSDPPLALTRAPLEL